VWIVVGVLVAGALAASFWWIGPPPPNEIRMATGSPQGAYAAFGEQYAGLLRASGLRVELVPSSGSIDNLGRLLRGEVDVAFVQAGTYNQVDDPEGSLRAIASLYHEPLWVFYRGDEEVTMVSEFRGRKIAVGPKGSGTEAVAMSILAENGITPANSELVYLPPAEAAAALEAGGVDVMFLVASVEAELVRRLLDAEGVRLMDFDRHAAYETLFPHLNAVELPEGVLDLAENVPGRPMRILAPVAMLVCRKDLHPRVVEQLLNAARRIHGRGTEIDPQGKFPSDEHLDLPLHETAEAYYNTGESLFSRVLPYWALRWVFRIQILILPLLALWLPMFKVFPFLYRFRVRRLLIHHYAALRDVETRIESAGRTWSATPASCRPSTSATCTTGGGTWPWPRRRRKSGSESRALKRPTPTPPRFSPGTRQTRTGRGTGVRVT